MPREQKYESPAARQAAYRARQQASAERDLERGMEVAVALDDARDARAPNDDLLVPDLCIQARSRAIVLTESQEQRIRNFWGYQESEKRTLLERDAAADRINELPS